jgi:hypothetical protein
MRPVARITAIALAVVAVAHLLRLLFRIEVTAGVVVIPQWMSVFGCLAPAALAVALWRESQR